MKPFAQSRFVLSAAMPADLPPAGPPELAFAGRSNVGKSSLLNTLVRRKAFARVSRTPGRTREVNFFAVNDAMVIADLPGYGYARISKEAKQGWRPLIEGYLRNSPALQGVVQLLDVRHDPTDEDLQMLDFLADLGAPTLVVLTKTDKLGARAPCSVAFCSARESLSAFDSSNSVRCSPSQPSSCASRSVCGWRASITTTTATGWRDSR